MKKSNTLIVLLLTLIFLGVEAQEKAYNRCGTFDQVQQYKAQNPDFEQRMAKMTAEWQVLKQEKKAVETVYIPLVFHVLHTVESGEIMGNNISDEQIISQIDRLNKDYAGLNIDIGEVPVVFESVVAKRVDIQFCLAEVSPDGQATNGIVRRYTTTNDFDTPPATGGPESMKFTAQGGSDAWPTCQYLNVWVLPSIDGGSTLGYAQFPASLPNAPGADASTDGIVLAHNFVGDEVGTAESPFDMGRTATHEVGHWLGLYHTFEGGCSGLGDEVEDTPAQNISTLGCPSSINETCGSPDMYVNYMDYSNDECLLMFTNQQFDRMLMLLNMDESRSCFLTNGSNCTVELSANFVAEDTTLCLGSSVQFLDQSSGARSSWQWTFEGGEPMMSFEQSPVVTYNQAGSYDVTLIIANDEGAFLDTTKMDYITVFEEGNCPAEPCVAFTFGQSPLGGPFDNLNPVPCGETCGTPTVTPFEVYSNEAYTMNELLAGNSYNISICAGAVNWEPVLSVAHFDGDVVGDIVAFVDSCSLDFTVPTAGNYILVVTEKDKCDGGPTNQIDNGVIELSCLGNNTCAPIEGPCIDFILGTGGPYDFLNPVPKGADCETVVASTPFDVYSNEAYTLLDLTAGEIYDISLCEGNNAGTWNPVLTIAKYDVATQTVGDVIDFTIGCELKFYVPENGNYLVVITEEDNCNGEAPNLIENGFLTVACGNVGCNLFPFGPSPEGGGPFNNLNPVPVGETCTDSLTTPFAVYSNEGYTLEALVANNSYNVNICYGAGAGAWTAVLTLANYDVENLEMGEVVTFAEGCELNFTVPTDGDYIIVVTETGVCNANPPNQIENGQLTIQCTDFEEPVDTTEVLEPCIDFVTGDFPLGGPFNNINVEIDGVLRAPCGEKCDTTTGFEVYINEAYYIRRAIEGASYNINICEGPNAGSWPPLLTVAYYDTTTMTVGEVVAVADSCAIDFSVPTSDNYVVIITESGNCDGSEPVQTDNGYLSMSCTGNNPCQEGAACTEFVAGQFPLGGPFIDINENSTLCGIDCGDTLTIDAFEIYANEAYTFNNILEGNSYNINICTGPNAGSFESILTIAYYDVANEMVGDPVSFIAGCSLDFTAPADSSYILVITEKDKCEEGLGPVQVNNGYLQVICLGVNPCLKPCSNDECVAAIPLDITFGAVSPIFDNSCATAADTDPVDIVDECFAFGDDFQSSLWYTFEGTGSGMVISVDINCVGLTNGIPDAQMAIYEESCTGELVVCDEDSGIGFLSSVEFNAELGVIYYLVVDGWGPAIGEYCLKATAPFGGLCSVGTTDITLPDGTIGSGTTANPYQLCTDAVIELSSLDDLVINPVVANNPAIAWIWYSGQPTITDPSFDTNAIGFVTDINGDIILNNGTTTFDASGLELGTYTLVPVILPNRPSNAFEDGWTGIYLDIEYPVFTFLDSIACQNICGNSAGTMPNDLVEVCLGESVTINSDGDAILNTAADDQAIYVLHTRNDTILGTILAQNSTGTFSASDSSSIATNQVYYVSLIIAPAGDLTNGCTKVAAGTPIIFAGACNELCQNSTIGTIGTMSNEQQIICDRESTEVTVQNATVSNTATGKYVLHTNSGATLGIVLAENADSGTFSSTDNVGIDYNEIYYISFVITEDAAGGEACPLVNEGTPVVFLAPITFNVDEFCNQNDPNQFVYTVTVQVNGGMPSFDINAFYNIQGDYVDPVNWGNPFTLTFPEALGENNYELTVNDGFCQVILQSPNFECNSKPIELIAFDGEVLAEGNAFKWTTATESNNDFFTLQRSTNGVDFEAVSNIAAVGNSLVTQRYSYLDKNAPAGLNYYRLQQTDFDGTSTLSQVILLERAERSFGITQISPLPAQSLVDISFNSEQNTNVELKLFDAQGRLVFTKNQPAINGANVMQLNISSFSTGIYFIQLNNGSKILSSKLMKE